jgi:hypothetical protein
MSYELIKKYQSQYEEFCKIDDFNLESITKRVPAEKHFWVCRLIDAKIEKDRLIRLKNKKREDVQQKLLNESPVKLNKQFLDKIDESDVLVDLTQKIKDQDFVIEYLDLLVRQVTFIAQDIKNIVEIKRLQEM